MVEDVEAVRAALGLGKINLLGHSFGGALAQAYALKYQEHLSHLILCSTFHSTKQLNEVFQRMLADMTPELRGRIERMEKEGLFGHGKDYEKNRYTSDYMTAAWGEGYPRIEARRPAAERAHDLRRSAGNVRGGRGRVHPRREVASGVERSPLANLRPPQRL
jgi:proline iminopeptidase